MENILFYTDAYSTRLRYIVDFLLCNLLGINPLYANNPSQLSQSTLPKIIYSGMETFSAVSAQATGVWLHRRHPILTEKGVNCHYSTDFADDLLAHAFFELSRYEEYAAEQRDTHGRFTSAQSLAYKKGYLQRPIVHEIAAVLMQKLSQHYPNLRFQTPTYSFQPTYDIDMAWKYAHKGAFRICANLCRDALTLDYQAIWTKFQVYLGHRADPDFVFSYMERLHEVFGLTPIYFWLLGDYGKFDKNISFDNKIFQTLICKIAQQYPVGIHPSYASNQSVELLMKEIARLRQLTGRPVLMSRQHFLKLNLPSTYHTLLQLGIRADYTMGYADNIGFRAGVSIPFDWYDIENECVTNLKIYPFQVMDVTLQQYLALTPEAAIQTVQTLIDTTRNAGGAFMTLWHNSSLSEDGAWKNWRKVYEQILNYATK